MKKTPLIPGGVFLYINFVTTNTRYQNHKSTSMKKLIYSVLILIFSFHALLAQTPSRVTTPSKTINYDALKTSHQMNPHFNYQQVNPNPAPQTVRLHQNTSRSIVCNCDIAL